MQIERLGGLTNHTYKTTLPGGKEVVVRIPGEGTEEMIVRGDEKVSTQLANDLGIDAALLYFGADGAKVSEYIPRRNHDVLRRAARGSAYRSGGRNSVHAARKRRKHKRAD